VKRFLPNIRRTLLEFEPPLSRAASQADATDEELNMSTFTSGSHFFPNFEDQDEEENVYAKSWKNWSKLQVPP